ncbi:putative ferric-chelate reductase 1 [Myxocyprinus asiaticus]|uniref:putative ferric-chelate reductase 1 n=1 Tax=Myxocyprinus asiaticus TaxID=70543 RepID=UPI0022217B84|nr:putative ferric-chelate reductase 1 [Myxocyprinus asiaticus]XP_051553336.1 putative ferric-chelate reductase 1 [Myxocyprinus asiaticus]
MDNRLMFLVVFVISCAVPCIKADGHLSPPTILTSNITRGECGINKLCVEKPTKCDPSGSSQCFFTSTWFSTNTTSLAFELSGNSTGYIALAAGVNSSLSQGTNVVFVCGNNNGTFFFRTAVLTNNTLVITNSPNVSNIQGSIQQTLIQCVFNIPIDFNISNTIGALATLGIKTKAFSFSNRANTTINTFIEIFQGSTNGTVLGQPQSVFGSSFLVYLANPNSTAIITSSPTNTTATPNTTFVTVANGSISLTSLLSQAAIALLSIFTLRLL